jgi:uncharacterized protein (TIGR04255 family)
MAELPQYAKPPIAEVAVGVQFPPITSLHAPHVGLYWTTIRSEFPTIEEHPTIGRFHEPLGDVPQRQEPPIQILQRPDLPRTWFLDADGSALVQLQRDRFVYNWRRTQTGPAYPRYPAIMQRFLEQWQNFGQFLGAEGLPLPEVDQCELTYVNYIPEGECWTALGELSSIFSWFEWPVRSGFLPQPDLLNMVLRFPLTGEPGRLYANVQPIRTGGDATPTIRFSLMARGRPAESVDAESLRGWFDTAHDWIVRAFADLTDEAMDTVWERER